MRQYLDLLEKILTEGVEKESGRANMPNTIGISNAIMKFDMKDGFPLLTTRKMYLKGIIFELLWILRGETNIKYLVDNDVNIWNQDAYRWYLKFEKEAGLDKPRFNLEEFIEIIKKGDLYHSQNYSYGDLGKVYGYQWRNQNGVDQVADVLNGLKSNPYSRYHIIDAWNKADFKDMALPPCHLLYQFIVRPLSIMERNSFASKMEFRPHEVGHNAFDEFDVPKFYLDLNMYQRSCDTLLGISYNAPSMSLLLMIMSKATNMIPGVATWIGGDTHIYTNHVEGAREQLKRKPFKFPTIKITKDINTLEDIESLKYEDFILENYEYHPAIKFVLSTGL